MIKVAVSNDFLFGLFNTLLFKYCNPDKILNFLSYPFVSKLSEVRKIKTR